MTWEALLCCLVTSCLLVQLITFAVITWAVLRYIRARRLAINITTRIMQMDELIDELLETPDMSVTGSGVPVPTVGISEKDS